MFDHQYAGFDKCNRKFMSFDDKAEKNHDICIKEPPQKARKAL